MQWKGRERITPNFSCQNDVDVLTFTLEKVMRPGTKNMKREGGGGKRREAKKIKSKLIIL